MSDFNRDGFPDLAIGIPEESLGDDPRSGAVAILNGSIDGLVGEQILDQEILGLETNEEGDLFGEELAIGDFNDDDFDDLVIGIPRKSPGDDPQSGAVAILNGSTDGLVANSIVDQETLGVGTNEAEDLFGANLAVGDFNNDDFDDLVIAAPQKSFDEAPEAGALVTLNGSADGLTSDRFIDQETLGLGTNEAEDLFGAALAVGDFNDDDFDDLVVGVPQESFDNASQAGEIVVLNGSTEGLISNQTINQETSGLGTNEAEDLFGATLAVGDFDGDGFDDLVVAAPQESLDEDFQSGNVTLFRGSADGLVSDRAIDQETLGLGTNEVEDLFGAALTVGDFNRDGFDDLAIGIPGKTLENVSQAGSVAILNGSATGLVANSILEQESSGLEINDTEDLFGAALTADDFNQDGFDDLIVGIPGNNRQSGAAALFNGSGDGLVANSIIDQETLGLETNEPGEFFGVALASGSSDEIEIASENTIELFRFRNIMFETGTYIFVGAEERDFILNDPNLNQLFTLDGVADDGTINPAFTASTKAEDGLIPFFRLESLTVAGTFLFVSTAEYDFIFDDPVQSQQWKKQGFDPNNETEDIPEFYLLDGTANQGINFNRFQNEQNGTFLYAGAAETSSIINNPDLADIFMDQGIAFESL